jgi:HD-GYP domain-containing protein (c-di-GMP phosphodiesterase class II)
MEQQPLDSEGVMATAAARPSVLRRINESHHRLEHLLFHIDQQADAQGEVLAIARTLSEATAQNPDIALACILLNQNVGTYAVRHCVDTAIVAAQVALALQKGRHEILSVMAGALTMNIGMLREQEQLQQRVNAISQQDKAMIHGHPEHGVDILRRAGITDDDWLDYVLLHHENEDGSGYPFGKSGDDIPLGAKLISLADRYCARVSTRSYRKSLLPKEALNEILLVDHHSVDPMLTACFIGVLGVYPTGATVRLANGDIGVVTGKGKSTNAPIVQALRDGSGETLPAPLRRDTGRAEFAVREMLSDEQAGIKPDMHRLWGEEALA